MQKNSILVVQLALYVAVGSLAIHSLYVLTNVLHYLLVSSRAVKAKVVVVLLSPHL